MIGGFILSLYSHRLPKGLSRELYDAIKDTAFLFDGTAVSTVLFAFGKLGLRAEQLPLRMIVAIELSIRKAKGKIVHDDIALIFNALRQMNYQWSMLTVHTQQFLADELCYFVCETIRNTQNKKQLSVRDVATMVNSLGKMKVSWYDLPGSARLGLTIAVNHLLDQQQRFPQTNLNFLVSLWKLQFPDLMPTVEPDSSKAAFRTPLSLKTIHSSAVMPFVPSSNKDTEQSTELDCVVDTPVETIFVQNTSALKPSNKFSKLFITDLSDIKVYSPAIVVQNKTKTEKKMQSVNVLSYYRALCSLPTVDKMNSTMTEEEDAYFIEHNDSGKLRGISDNLSEMTELDVFQLVPRSDSGSVEQNYSGLDFRLHQSETVQNKFMLLSRGTIAEELFKLQLFYKNSSNAGLKNDIQTSVDQENLLQQEARGYANMLLNFAVLYTNPKASKVIEKVENVVEKCNKRLPANIERILFECMVKYQGKFTLQGISNIIFALGKFKYPWQSLPWNVKYIILKSLKQIIKEISIDAASRAVSQTNSTIIQPVPKRVEETEQGVLTIDHQNSIHQNRRVSTNVGSIPASQAFVNVLQSLINMGFRFGYREDADSMSKHEKINVVSKDFAVQLMHLIENYLLKYFSLDDIIQLINTLTYFGRTDVRKEEADLLINVAKTLPEVHTLSKQSKSSSTFDRSTSVGVFSFRPSFKTKLIHRIMKQLHWVITDPARYQPLRQRSSDRSATIVQLFRVLYALEFTSKDIIFYRPPADALDVIVTNGMNVLLKAVVVDASRLSANGKCMLDYSCPCKLISLSCLSQQNWWK